MKKASKKLHPRKSDKMLKTSIKGEDNKLNMEGLIDLTGFVDVEMKGSRIIVKPKIKKERS